jgi:hypothetical protein
MGESTEFSDSGLGGLNATSKGTIPSSSSNGCRLLVGLLSMRTRTRTSPGRDVLSLTPEYREGRPFSKVERELAW